MIKSIQRYLKQRKQKRELKKLITQNREQRIRLNLLYKNANHGFTEKI
jgi:hypothetical protein